MSDYPNEGDRLALQRLNRRLNTLVSSVGYYVSGTYVDRRDFEHKIDGPILPLDLVKQSILNYSNPQHREYIRENPVVWNDLVSKVQKEGKWWRRQAGEKDQLDDIFGPQSGGRRKNNRRRYY